MAIYNRIDSLPLNSVQLMNIQERYLTLLFAYSSRRSRYSYAFHSLRFIITVGSLIVPAFLSFPYMNGSVQSDSGALMSFQTYLVTWILSLLVTISNGLIALMKIEKRYYTMHTVFEQLVSEGWQFIHLTGRYGPKKDEIHLSHEQQYTLFTHMIEKIKMKQVEEEYFRASELGNTQQNTTQTQGQQMIPRTGTEMNPNSPFIGYGNIQSSGSIPSFYTQSTQIPLSRNSTGEVNGRHVASVSLYSPTGSTQGKEQIPAPQTTLPSIAEESSANEY
jgi:hypothetical protein